MKLLLVLALIVFAPIAIPILLIPLACYAVCAASWWLVRRIFGWDRGGITFTIEEK